MPAILIAFERNKAPPEMPNRLCDIGVDLGFDILLKEHLRIVAYVLVLLGAKLCQILVVLVDERLVQRALRPIQQHQLMHLPRWIIMR